MPPLEWYLRLINMALTHVCQWFLKMVTTQSLGQYVLYQFFPLLTEDWKLLVLLIASSKCHHLTCTYLIQPSLLTPGFPKK